MKIEAALRAAGAEILALEQVRELLHDMCFECENDRHTLDGKKLIVIDDAGVELTRGGGGYFAWPNGRRIGPKTRNWPAGHRAEPCGECWACQVVSLGIGYLGIHDGRGHREVRL